MEEETEGKVMPQRYEFKRAPAEARAAKGAGTCYSSNVNDVALKAGGKDAESRLDAVWEWLIGNSGHWIANKHVSVGVITDCLLKAIELRARLGEGGAVEDDSVEGLVKRLSEPANEV